MNKKIIAISAAFAVVVPFTSVLAEDVVTTSAVDATTQQTQKDGMRQQRQDLRAQNQEDRSVLKEQKGALKQDRCKNTEERISTRINRYENGQAMFQKVFGNMKARLERLTSRLDSAGADTTKLKTDLQTLYGKIDKLNTDYATFVAGLKETQPLACGEAQGEFKGKLGEARKQLPQIIQDRKDIRSFFQTTIKADLAEIRKQLGVVKEEKRAEKESTKEKTQTPEITN